jgi:ribosome-associated toxin RatA of RatAB toxin-antitoxin module
LACFRRRGTLARVTRIHKSAVVPFSASQMYALVDDIESYPQFLPWCTGAKILARGDGELTASLALAMGKLRKTLTTRNTLRPWDYIEMRLVEGPFRHLHGEWRFQQNGAGCRISLDMDFEFKNRMLKLALGMPFRKIADSMMEAFIRRAEELYGS